MTITPDLSTADKEAFWVVKEEYKEAEDKPEKEE